MHRIRKIFPILGLSLGCSSALIPSSEARGESLTIAAAASLDDALKVMTPDLEATVPRLALRISLGGSGTLEQQIVQGAPIDIFLSAADRPIRSLEAKKLLSPHSTKVFLRNQLVLIGPKASKLKSVQDLKGSDLKRIAIGEPRSVPAGEYAMQAFEALKIAAVLTPKLLYAKDVRQVLRYVERGEVEAGVVYESDLTSALGKGVKRIESLPDASHEPIRYTMAIVAGSERKLEAEKILNYLESPRAIAVWKRFGFKPYRERSTAAGKASFSVPN